MNLASVDFARRPDYTRRMIGLKCETRRESSAFCRRGALVAIIGMVFLAGCTEESKNFTVPTGLRKIHVRTFENTTYELGLEDLITHKTIDAILKDAQIAAVDEPQANAVLRGRIDKYVRQPLAFDQNNVATLYRIYIVVHAELINSKTNEVFWVEPLIDHETTYSTVAAPIETEAMAKDRLADLVATDMLTRVTQGWINVRK